MVSLLLGLATACCIAFGPYNDNSIDDWREDMYTHNEGATQSVDCASRQADKKTDISVLSAAAIEALRPQVAITSFDIPPQKASSALIAFGQQAHITVLLEHGIEDFHVEGLTGNYSIADGLQRLLRGTDLSYRIADDSIIISRKNTDESLQKTTDKSSFFAAISTAFLSMFGSTSVYPQNMEADQRNFGLEEIIVTAEKRSETVADLPMAVSAFSGDSLTKQSINSLKDLVQIAPSLNFGDTDGNAYISIRGIGGDIPNTGAEPGVSVSQDGVPFLTQFLFDAIFLDVARVEILRGPQGTIAGRNATGGAINIISNLPTELFEASLKTSFGNYNRTTVEGFASGPISDRIKARVAFNVDRADGYMKNTLLGQRLNNRDRQQLRLSFLADISNDLEAVLILEGINDGRNILLSGMNASSRPDQPDTADVLGVTPVDVESLRFQSGDRNQFQKDQYMANLRLTWNLGTTSTLTSTTAYIDFVVGGGGDYDGTVLRLSDIPMLEIDHRQVTQELTWTTDLTDNTDLILGALLLHAQVDFPLEFASEDGYGFGRGLLVHNDHQTLESYAVYSQWRYRISDQWRISVGARYTSDTKEYSNDGLFFGQILDIEGEKTWSEFTPKFTVDYQPVDDLTAYFTVSKGFKAGGFNSFQSVAPDKFDQETVWNYELGLKASWLDNRVKTAFTAFYMDYTGVQQNLFTGLAPDVLNAGDATITGLESEVEALVADNLRIIFSGTWLDTEFGKILTLDPIYPELGVRNLEGNRLTRAPKWQSSLATEYTVNVANDLNVVFKADYAYKGHVFHSFYNHENVAQDGYGLVNVGVDLENAAQTWRVSAFATNLEDKRYISNSYTSDIAPYFKAATFGEPRMYGLSLTYHFD